MFPGQRENKGPHLRDWGCKIHCMLYIVSDKLKLPLSPDNIRDITINGIRDGVVWDNEIPWKKEDREKWEADNGQRCPEWYRVFVPNSEIFLEYAAKKLGAKVHSQELWRGAPDKRPVIDADYYEIEFSTSQGSHFCIADKSLKVIYDPWPELKRGAIRTVRLWSLL